MGAKVLISGGTGLIGSALIPKLTKIGYQVRLLSRYRNSDKSVNTYTWDVQQGLIEANALDDIDFIIHLAGANIGAGRWTKSRKQVILDSRVNSTKLLLDQTRTLGLSLKAFVSSSAVGFYGMDTGDTWMDESKPQGAGFLAEVTNQWENEALQFQDLNVRTVCLRSGIVLSSSGGALEKMALPVKLGAGAPLGSGKQYISWIHIDDLCEAFILALENDSWSGVYNATAPNPVINKEFFRILARTLKKPMWLPNVPQFSLRLMLGEMASIVLGGNRASAKKIMEQGMIFGFPELYQALEDLLD